MTDINEVGQGAVLIGIGGCGMNMMLSWLEKLPKDTLSVAINRDQKRLSRESGITHKILLVGVSSVDNEGELKRASQAQVEASMAQEMPRLKSMIQGRENIILLAGMGGVTGTWVSPWLCNQLIAMGMKLITVLVMPFGFEGKRIKAAEKALTGFDGEAHRVLCFNDYLIKHTPDGTSMEDAFKIMNEKAFDLIPF